MARGMHGATLTAGFAPRYTRGMSDATPQNDAPKDTRKPKDIATEYELMGETYSMGEGAYRDMYED